LAETELLRQAPPEVGIFFRSFPQEITRTHIANVVGFFDKIGLSAFADTWAANEADNNLVREIGHSN
jgi:hypothetical protein